MPDAARTRLSFRPAHSDDLPAIVALLADDELGATREELSDPLPDAYLAAFAAISADANNELIVASAGGVVAGVLQLTFIPGLSRSGSWRAQIEGVRIHRDFRDQGLGRQLLEHALDRARQRGCRLVQLTSDKRRSGALRFYEQLGFTASHEGFKLQLSA
jgi:ribosomal protein S18 acetylase RimI-like enzyme